jgi:hypothetical protein
MTFHTLALVTSIAALLLGAGWLAADGPASDTTGEPETSVTRAAFV